MQEERLQRINELENASPLEISAKLVELELYDRQSSQAVIDEVYEQFRTAEHMKDSVLKPVFLSVVDGLLEATSSGRRARKKGLTASRVVQECETFRYDDEQSNATAVNGYTEYKNARDYTTEYGEEVRGGYQRTSLEDKTSMNKYKEERVRGEKRLEDEYTGKLNLYNRIGDPDGRYKEGHREHLAETDHIVPLKEIHEQFKGNFALDDKDIKDIANAEYNFAVTAAKVNDGRGKGALSNEEYIKKMEEKGTPLDETTKKNMLELQKSAEKAINNEANKAVLNNLLDPEKMPEIGGKLANNAGEQAKDYAVGNVILFIIKPLYYEISDIFKNGLTGGVGASSGTEALKIRFGRVKGYVLEHSKEFLGDNVLSFVKGFISSLIEGIISLFVGVFKQVLKVIKEGIKIFVQSAKILFGKDSGSMSSAEKGDAIVKLVGGSIIAISGIGIEFLLNKIGIGEPWSVVLATMLSGIASALFMYLMDKADIFSVKAEKRRDRILEIFNERINEINTAAEQCNTVALETLRRQRESFDEIKDEIDDGLKSNSIDKINAGFYKMAQFMGVKLEYSNTKEFCDYMDSEGALEL